MKAITSVEETFLLEPTFNKSLIKKDGERVVLERLIQK